MVNPINFISALFRLPTGRGQTKKGRCKVFKRNLNSLLSPILSDPPDYKPSSEQHYSNAGIVFAGLMAEEITGLTWEDMVFKEVIEPMGITSGGFGAPGTKKYSFSTLGRAD